jgi:hypothetical protein
MTLNEFMQLPIGPKLGTRKHGREYVKTGSTTITVYPHFEYQKKAGLGVHDLTEYPWQDDVQYLFIIES